jgi:hypothetical protein
MTPHDHINSLPLSPAARRKGMALADFYVSQRGDIYPLRRSLLSDPRVTLVAPVKGAR